MSEGRIVDVRDDVDKQLICTPTNLGNDDTDLWHDIYLLAPKSWVPGEKLQAGDVELLIAADDDAAIEAYREWGMEQRRTLTDTEALDRIASGLKTPDWSASTIEDVFEIVEMTGRDLTDWDADIDADPNDPNTYNPDQGRGWWPH